MLSCRDFDNYDGLRAMDFVLSSPDANSPDLFIDGTNVLEKIAHLYHMQMV